MVKCMLKAPLHLKGPIRKLFYRLIQRVFFGIDIVCALFWLVIFSSCCFMLFMLCMVQLCLVVKKNVLIWQICFIHLFCSSSHKISILELFTALFFFSVILFFNTDLKCKEGVLHVWVMLPFHLFCYLCYHVLMLNSFSLRKKNTHDNWYVQCM